jgi:hypothetical protein
MRRGVVEVAVAQPLPPPRHPRRPRAQWVTSCPDSQSSTTTTTDLSITVTVGTGGDIVPPSDASVLK